MQDKQSYETLEVVMRGMNRDFALLDANLARVREGLRCLGEIARFALVDSETFAALKTLRHQLIPLERQLGSARLVNARQGSAPGAGEVVKSEYARHTLYGLIRANGSRVAESLRVLEEFSKLYAPPEALNLESARYKIYALERALLTGTPQFWFQLYASEGFIYPLSSEVDELMSYVNRGARVVQLRDKDNPKATVFENARILCKFIAAHNQKSSEKVLFILNDHVDIAGKLPVAGVHLGPADGAVSATRRALGSNKIIGCSNQTPAEVAESVAAGADYVSLGPIFKTPLKPDKEAVGLEIAAEALDVAQGVPLVAIGGINRANIHLLYQRGVNNIAVIRAAPEFF